MSCIRGDVFIGKEPSSAILVEALDSLGAGLAILDSSRAITYANPAAEAILRCELRGKHLRDLLTTEAGSLALRVSEAIRLGRPIDRAECSLDGQPPRDVGFSVQLGRREEVTLLCRDITGQKRLRDRLDETEGLALVAEVAGSIAHEIRNPLATVSASVELLAESLELDPADRRLMGNVLAESARMGRILQAFQELAAGVPERREDLALSALVRDAIAEIEAERGARVPVAIAEHGEPQMRGAREPLRRALGHLVRNALDASNPESPIEIELESRGPWARITLRDWGHGIAEEIGDQIYRPFFTTRPGHSGLGLAVVRRVVDHHGGRLDIRPSLEGGTEAIVNLPTQAEHTWSDLRIIPGPGV